MSFVVRLYKKRETSRHVFTVWWIYQPRLVVDCVTVKSDSVWVKPYKYTVILALKPPALRWTCRILDVLIWCWVSHCWGSFCFFRLIGPTPPVKISMGGKWVSSSKFTVFRVKSPTGRQRQVAPLWELNVTRQWRMPVYRSPQEEREAWTTTTTECQCMKC